MLLLLLLRLSCDDWGFNGKHLLFYLLLNEFFVCLWGAKLGNFSPSVKKELAARKKKLKKIEKNCKNFATSSSVTMLAITIIAVISLSRKVNKRIHASVGYFTFV
jgi:hypothetical protein